MEKLEPMCVAGGNGNSAAVVENSLAVPQKIKDKITVIPFWGIYPK